MKRSPDMARLEETLRGSKIVAGGFLGTDRRPIEEIVESDAADLARAGYTCRDVATRLQDITKRAESGLGSWVPVGPDAEAAATDTRGVLPCPWAHPGRFPKTVVTLRNTRNGKTIQWSALSVHLIGEHGFFQGRGAAWRLEPATLLDLLFPGSGA